MVLIDPLVGAEADPTVLDAMSDEVALYKITERNGVILYFQWQNGIFRTDLGTNRTSDTEILINDDLVPCQIHGGAAEVVDTGPVIFTFVLIHLKWPYFLSLADCPCK